MIKIKVIENIVSPYEAGKVIVGILKNKGFTNIEIVDQCVKADIEGPLGLQRFLFYQTVEYLGKKTEHYNSIVLDLKQKLKGCNYSHIYIVSTQTITEGFKQKIKTDFGNFNFNFWDRDNLVRLIDEDYPSFWRHNDQELLSYEKIFEDQLNDDWSIKKIKQFQKAHEKLLNIFVEPRLLHKVNDFESTKKALVKISIDKLHEISKPVILEGEPGIGKTRLLKQIGLEYIKRNTSTQSTFSVPIFINNVNLLESKNQAGQIDIVSVVGEKLKSFFPSIDQQSVFQRYKVIILIDSIDEFDKTIQEGIISGLKSLPQESIQIFLGTRYQDFSLINGIASLGKCEEIYVEKFNDHQIKLFLSLYFKNDLVKAGNLLTSLKENSIIQRLPITPLNLSLISILYEENNFEIPATITDIYDNFSNLLLGRSLPDSSLDFFDITIRERILSAYALEILQKGERNYMTTEEFHQYFMNFFKDISGTIDLTLLPNALDYIINNTGILVLQDKRYVRFMHESYMEYYASREIFYYQKEALEPLLVKNFLDLNWQYTAIFYAGRTKEMATFLKHVMERTNKSNKILEFYKSIYGLGYLSQALYLTNDNLRKEAILNSLNYIVEIYDWMKKLGSDEKIFFKSLPLSVTAILNTMLFLEYNNSNTLRKPLELAFDELKITLESKDNLNNTLIDSTVAFKMFCIALTLASPRINNLSKIEYLVYSTTMLNDPFFEHLLEFGVGIAGSKELHELKEQIKNPKRIAKKGVYDFNKEANHIFSKTPMGRLRFTQYDRILPNRQIRILTEGKTDAQIIEHAFNILTGEIPYWEIAPVHEDNGGANELAKCLSNCSATIGDKMIIGIFDNDSKGIQEFNGLPKSKFDFLPGSLRIKKHKEKNIFALKIPIFPSRKAYLNETQELNFFSIEHYFSDELLKSKSMFTAEKLPGIFAISDTGSKKSDFSKYVRTLESPDLFIQFGHLFNEIDLITGYEGKDYTGKF